MKKTKEKNKKIDGKSYGIFENVEMKKFTKLLGNKLDYKLNSNRNHNKSGNIKNNLISKQDNNKLKDLNIFYNSKYNKKINNNLDSSRNYIKSENIETTRFNSVRLSNESNYNKFKASNNSLTNNPKLSCSNQFNLTGVCNNSRLFNLTSVCSNSLTNKFFMLIFLLLVLIIFLISFVLAQPITSSGTGINVGTQRFASNPVTSSDRFYGSNVGGQFNGAGGSYFYSNPQLRPGFAGSYGGAYGGVPSSALYPFIYGGNASSAREFCRERQDFILQIAPGGCTPAVVRSDLLAEQNVPVFCKLQALQINPSINPQDIRAMTFSYSGMLPNGVTGVSYYQPARYGLSPKIGQNGFPSLDNVGYVVIILKQQPNERNLSDFVAGNLTARIQYSSSYAFGTGINEKNIPVLSDAEWAANYPQYTFMDGKNFIRVDSIEATGIRISVYSDANRRIDSFFVQKGRSSERALPGFYCSAAYSVTYVDAVRPEKKATIVFDQDVQDVYRGDLIAGGICKVTNVVTSGADSGTVIGSCQTTNGQRQFSLQLKLKNVALDFPGSNSVGYSPGEKLYSGGNADIYLGSVGISKLDRSSYAVLIALDNGQQLTDELKQRLNILSNQQVNTGFQSLNYNNKQYEIAIIKQGESIRDYQGKDVKFSNFISSNEITTGDSVFENYFSSSIDQYKVVEEDYRDVPYYSQAKEVENPETYGKKSLIEAIRLASGTKKGKVLADLVLRFNEKYPNSEKELPAGTSVLSNSQLNSDAASFVFELYGQTHVLQLRSVEDPSSDKLDVKILVDGDLKTPKQTGDYLIFPGNDLSTGKPETNIQLGRFDEQAAEIIGNCVYDGSSRRETENIFVGSRASICGRDVYVQQINIQRVARIRITPQINNLASYANVSYAIGIEKRAFPLNPEKAAERIKRLNESIAKWQNISESLGSVVKGMKAACFATSAALQVKNLFANLGGKAIARQEVMRGEGGWHERCAEEMKNTQGRYASVDDCFRKNSNAIEKEVELIAKHMNDVSQRIKNMESTTPDVVKSSGLLGGKEVNIQKSTDLNINYLIENYGSNNFEFKDPKGENPIKVSDVIKKERLSPDSISYPEMRDIETRLRILNDPNIKDNPELKEMTERKLYTSLSKAKEIQDEIEIAKKVESEAKASGIAGKMGVLTPRTALGAQVTDYYYGARVDTINGQFAGLDKATPVTSVILGSTSYYVALNSIPNSLDKFTLDFDKVYDKNGNKVDTSKKINEKDTKTIKDSLTETYNGRVLQKLDSQSYQNPYKDPEVRYYETEPYKGMPAIVPIDLVNGWYAATRQTLPAFGNIKVYQDSGLVSSFWLCNVGKNGRAEFDSGFGDDNCQQFNTFTGQPATQFYGLSDSEAKRKVADSINALQQAASQYKPGVAFVNILGRRIKVGNPATNNAITQCADFMSPKDCQLLFNVCDPVICPSSRCNLGGKYYVNDVVQSGIAGSLFLCLPNYKEGIFIPVCLTGVHAGIDNYVSILKASRDCLQESITTGRYVGICDEITAVYQCEFFWKQVSPILNVFIPKLLEFATGQGGIRGGGEYLNVQAAWSNMQNSINFFTNQYGQSAFNAYKLRSTQDVGTQICKSFVSTKYPKKFQTLIEPDSPPQFSAWFDEIKQSDATIPATSHYKVFYHIFAGKDSGVYYSVYLRDAPGESFFQPTGAVTVATGFVGRGEYTSEARDFTAPSGFKQLCVRVNGQEECGFKQVSTSFALDYLRDKYIQNQLTNTQITSERACISGTSGALSLVNPNIQAGTEELINPQIYNSGIVRVCATNNPGGPTNIKRWLKVGYCDDQKVACWLDQNSINVALTPGAAGIRNATTDTLNKYAEQLDEIENQKRIGINGEIEGELNEIESRIAKLFATGLVIDESENEAKVLFAKLDYLKSKFIPTIDQDARILFDRARVNHAMAEISWINFILRQEEKREVETGKVEEEGVREENILANIALSEYNRWNYVKIQECSTEGNSVLKEYYNFINLQPQNCKNVPWSAVFISYVVKKAGLNFPFDSSHSNYFTKIRDDPGKYDCNAYSIEQLDNIKVGDILCNCRESGCPVTFANLKAGSLGHCGIIVSVNGDNLEIIGGNREDSVSKEALTKSDVRKNNDYYGFLSCKSNSNFISQPEIINEPGYTSSVQTSLNCDIKNTQGVSNNYDQKYETYKTYFEKYSNSYPNGFSEESFRALLTSISQWESSMTVDETHRFFMGYGDELESREDFADNPTVQVQKASAELKNAFDNPAGSYTKCNLDDDVKQLICILKVYKGGDNQEYVDNVLNSFNQWKGEFCSA
ncbi:DUF2272 domain-containing protein [Candidatus Pacearchaeota archaeon]|nr:DUF2272 domain-containing protein [Candidatus Pacearchaeota archaeon]